MERFVYSSLCFVNCLVQSLSLKSLIERFKHRLNCRRANIVAYESLLRPYTTMAKFDTDSFKIGVDTLCSVTMSANKSCFENLKPITGSMVGGIASGLPAAGIGTFCFKLEDCKGKIHTIKLFNSLYVPGLQTTLLCPQHWSQQDKSNSKDDGTYIKTCSNGVWLVWGQHKFKKFVPLDANTNTPTFQTAPGSFNYQAFEATYLAYDASSPRQHTVKFNASQLRGNHELDPAEFIATESINSSGRMGESEGVHDDDKTVHTSNLSHQDADPNGPCPIHPTGNHKWGECTRNKSNESTQRGTLTFSPSQHRDEAEINNDATVASNDQAELLRWHCRLGHLPFQALCKLAENGEIPKRLSKVKHPRCAGCLFGKMTKVPWRTKSKANSHVYEATAPGQCVSVDQLQSTQAGFFAQLKGHLTTKRYTAATIFVDHFSRLRYIHLMTAMTSEETIQAKQAFERFAADHGVAIKHYHTDNGRFADNAFKQHCEQNRQTISYCGVNAHFQNGVAERAIRDVTETARTMLLHAKARWPACVHLCLWPYALRNAVHIYNTAPVLPDGTSRIEKFSGTAVGFRMKDNHTFGCPVFALQNDLAAGNKIPKWSPRARLGLNLGPSPNHARNVNLVLNLSTGLCSPQFHCRFDDFFETTQLSSSDVEVQCSWKRLSGFATYNNSPTQRINQHVRPIGTNQAVAPTQDTEEDASFTNDISDDVNDSLVSEGVMVSEGADAPLPSTPAASAGTSSRGRVRTMSRAMQDSVSQRSFYGESNMHYMQALQAVTVEEAEFQYALDHDFHLGLQDRMRHPIAFHAEMMGDIMYFHQAMQQDDADEFVKAVVKEVNGHIEHNRWQLVHRDQVPEGIDPIPSVWSMRRKRNLTTNEVTKYKSRLNIHGGKQVYGMNYFETYAPVVTWFAIRCMIALAVMEGLFLRQIDFIQAYPQAPIETDMYMELPLGIETRHGNSKDHVLKLLANLYGQKQAGRVWNGYMVEKLRSIGFKPSLIDECVFYRDDVIFIVYVDDGIFISGDDDSITKAIRDISKSGLEIEDQGHPADYVGVAIKKHPNGYYEFNQRALIDSIIDDVNIGDAYTKPVPAKSSVILHHHKDSPPFSDCDFHFNYRSVTGKANYLAQTTRPDILFAVHQIAKFSSDPRKEHGEAIIYLVRYLKKTRDLGLRFKPDLKSGFECYCDADFSGNWSKTYAMYDPSTAKSRSGWVVFYARCPIIFASRLQSQVALSTTEAEYIALSTALRDVIPIMELFGEMIKRGHKVACNEPVIYCKVFEDNSGALELARLPKLRPRTKHINTCYHHFREHVRKGLIKILPVSTDDQIADTLTKPLAQNAFCRHRQALCGR